MPKIFPWTRSDNAHLIHGDYFVIPYSLVETSSLKSNASIEATFFVSKFFLKLRLEKNSDTKKASVNWRKLSNFGWKTGFEPATLGTTNRYSNQLSYNHHNLGRQKYSFYEISILLFGVFSIQFSKLLYSNIILPIIAPEANISRIKTVL